MKKISGWFNGRPVFKVARSRNNLNSAQWTLKREEWRERKKGEQREDKAFSPIRIRDPVSVRSRFLTPRTLITVWKKKKNGKYRLDERSFEWNRTAEETTLRHCRYFFFFFFFLLSTFEFAIGNWTILAQFRGWGNSGAEKWQERWCTAKGIDHSWEFVSWWILMLLSRSGMEYVRHVFSFFFLASFWENLKCEV